MVERSRRRRSRGGVWTVKMDFKHNADYTCDANGNVDVELPKKLYILRLWAKKGRALRPMFASHGISDAGRSAGHP